MNASELRACAPVDISDDDVLTAMKSMQGYIDITPADFREVYQVAYALARQRIFGARRAAEIMTSPVLTVPADADLFATATLLAENGISGAPVTDGVGRVMGVISEEDGREAQDGRIPTRPRRPSAAEAGQPLRPWA